MALVDVVEAVSSADWSRDVRALGAIGFPQNQRFSALAEMSEPLVVALQLAQVSEGHVSTAANRHVNLGAELTPLENGWAFSIPLLQNLHAIQGALVVIGQPIDSAYGLVFLRAVARSEARSLVLVDQLDAESMG